MCSSDPQKKAFAMFHDTTIENTIKLSKAKASKNKSKNTNKTIKTKNNNVLTLAK